MPATGKYGRVSLDATAEAVLYYVGGWRGASTASRSSYFHPSPYNDPLPATSSIEPAQPASVVLGGS